MSPLHMPKNELVQVLVGQAAYSLHMGLISTKAGNQIDARNTMSAMVGERF